GGLSSLDYMGNLNAPLANPTAADISPDGRWIIVRNSSGGGTTAYLFERGVGQSVATALTGSPITVTLRAETQGEAIGWNTNTTGFYTTSEGTNRPIWFYTFSTNSPPVLDPIGNQTVNEGDTLNFTAHATDPDLDSITYSLGPGAPAGASINANSGLFS